MALEAEAAVALVMRLCRSFDLAGKRPARGGACAPAHAGGQVLGLQDARRRFIYEAMECLGGNGYVEESLLPRLYREAPVNAIWEGSGNVMASMCCARRHREVVQTVLDALAVDGEGLPGVRETRVQIMDALAAGEAQARLAVERLALLAGRCSVAGERSRPRRRSVRAHTARRPATP